MDHATICSSRAARWSAVLLLCIAAGPATNPTTRSFEISPTTRPTRQQEVDQLFSYLVGEYSRQFATQDWVTRSVAVISIAQIPTESATKAIIDRLIREPHPIGRLVAWQAVLARVNLLSEAQFGQWEQVTNKMVKDNLFQGDLRVALLEMFAATPVTPEHRRFVQNLFSNTNSLDSSDIPTLVAMGRTIRAWGDAALVENLLSVLTTKDHAVRAKFVLKAAGAPPAIDADATEFVKWWSDSRAAFTKDKPATGRWTSLRPQFIDAPVDPAGVNPDDKKWRSQLELGSLGLHDFDFVISVDCSGSMSPTIERVKHDLLVMFSALGQVAQRPRIGITSFTTNGGTRTIAKLSGSGVELMRSVGELDIWGGGGGNNEEEWAGGLDLAIKSNNWRPVQSRSRRVIVMMTDEPITPDQYEKTAAVLKKAAKDGFTVHTLVVFPLEESPDPFENESIGRPTTRESMPAYMHELEPSTPETVEHAVFQYEELSLITGGQALIAQVTEGSLGLGSMPSLEGRRGRGRGRGRGRFGDSFLMVNPNIIAPVYPNGGPTAELLTVVLSSAINPQYAKRVEPLANILAAHSQRVAWVPEVRNR